MVDESAALVAEEGWAVEEVVPDHHGKARHFDSHKGWVAEEAG